MTAPTSARSPAPSVLIIDDHLDAADSLAQLLRLCGFEARVACSPEDALAADPADVVILELRLPGIDGWELARRLRDRATAKRPLLVAVTTCGREIDRRKSEAAGIDLHLAKPVDPAALLGVLGRFGRVLAPGRPG